MKNNKTKAPQSFLQGSFILVLATALVKVIGAIYKIPLTKLLGSVGMGYYSVAYDLYLPIYSLAMAGLPIAISKIVAENVAKCRYKDVATTFKVAKRMFLVTGLTGFIIMCALSYPFAKSTDSLGAIASIICITPSLLFCCVMSAYRGYYEGMRNMTPTAVSSVIEALGKLLLGYSMALIVMKTTGSLVYASAAALLGITIGTALGAGYLVIKYKRQSSFFTDEQISESPEPYSNKKTLKIILSVAIPIVLGSMATYVAGFIDVFMIKIQLSNAIKDHAEFFAREYAQLISECENGIKDLSTALYGCYKGYAYSIYNLVPVITSVLGVSALPVLVTSWAKEDKIGVKKNIETILRTTSLISLPAGLGMAAISFNILSFLYSSNTTDVAVSTPLLTVLGFAAALAGLTIPMTNMLQAIGKQIVPVINIAVGALIKIIVNFVLVGTPSVNIKGAPYGTLCCYAYIAIANFVCLVKFSHVMPNIMSTFIKPLIASLLCASTAMGVAKVLGNSIIDTLLALIAAVVVYVAAIIVLRVIEKDDVLGLPKGQKIASLLTKLKILR
ncbi:MAG: polysaccharide biosynthesis protein [Clostridia bacterium]|nr:polysaccharide biosynthesis protein [Clostridia bacterium]